MVLIRKATTFAGASLLADSVATADQHSSGLGVFAVAPGFNHAQHPRLGTNAKPPQFAPPLAPGRRCPCRPGGAYNGRSLNPRISVTRHASI